jgi:hypothetical protein
MAATKTLRRVRVKKSMLMKNKPKKVKTAKKKKVSKKVGGFPQSYYGGKIQSSYSSKADLTAGCKVPKTAGNCFKVAPLPMKSS